MTDQTVASDVRRRADETKLGEVGADSVNSRHEGDHFFLKDTRSESALDSSSSDAGPEWFRQNEQIARARVRVRCDTANIHDSGNRQTVNWFGITNGMAADQRTSDLGRLGQTAA